MNRNDKFDKKDPMFDQAVELVSKLETCRASTLQTRLAIGYARAGRIMGQMISAGIVGPEDAALDSGMHIFTMSRKTGHIAFTSEKILSGGVQL